jgi:hypothetical protein
MGSVPTPRTSVRATDGETMPFVHVQNGVFRRLANQRCYLFLRWHAQGKRWYQLADFGTVIEASCFLMGARVACQLSNKGVRLETMTPTDYVSTQRRRRQRRTLPTNIET